MPQLDQSTWISQLFWLAITFGVLWLFVRSYVAPRLQSIVGNRENAIADDLSQAEAARRKNAKIEAGHEREITEAHTRARELVAAAQSDAGKQTSARAEKTRGEIETRLAAAKIRIDAAKTKALGELDVVAADMAREIVRRVSGLDVKEDAALKALAEVKPA